MGAVGATEFNNASNTEDSNLMTDNVDSLSVENKLEVSNEDSISEANLVNSHDDDLNNYSDSDVLSNYEDDYGNVQASNYAEIDNTNSVRSNVLSVSNDDNLAASSKVSAKVDVVDTHYSKSATYFKVTLKDTKGNSISNQKISFKVNGVTYTATTDKNGIASVKTAALSVGTYTVAIKYAGSSKYAAVALSKKVKVLSSVSGSDITKYYGPVVQYSVKFWKNYNALANTKVSFKVNGITYTKTTDKNGVAKLPVNLAPGKYVITTTNPYSGEKLSNKCISLRDGTTLTHGSTNTYITPNKKHSFTVTLKSKHGILIKNKNVIFKYNNKKVTVKTNSNGKATLSIPALSKGTYYISYSYSGDKYYSGSSESGKLYVKNPTTKITSSKLNMQYKDGSKFAVKLTKNGKVLANKNVKLTFNGKTYTEKTNSKGIAYLNVPTVKPATYNIKYQYLTPSYFDYCYGSNKIVVSKQTAKVSAGDLVMNYKDGSVYKVVVKNKFGNPLKNIKVKFTINGKTYTKTTDSNGVAKQSIGLNIGYYSVKTVLSNNYYAHSAIYKHISVKGTKFVGGNIHVAVGKTAYYSVKLLDYKNNPIKSTKVTFILDGKKYTATTSSKGVAKVNLGVLSAGTHNVKYSHGSYSGSSNIYVADKVTIKQIIAASGNVQKYIQKNHRLPSTVNIGGVTYSTNQYLYLVSKAIVNLKSNVKSAIYVKNVGGPSNPSSTYAAGNLYDYLSVAKSVVKNSDSKGSVPNTVSSKVGTIGYKSLVYAFARVVAFYGDDDRLPSFVEIKSLSGTSSDSDINSKNTISNLKAYLAASTNCQVNNAKIKQLVGKLTNGLKSEKSKATAIYNYVRDTISYSFYYDTKHGAVGTLNAKSGNCVDHSHLLAAMFRTAGLATRYVHGSCTFSSGSTYGHVWTQVLIDNTWTVADATSSRNSLGKIANWNTKSYRLNGYYSSLPF
ncbi:Transglutaminase-like enzyme, putative cysteine protease [Methanobrevibacter gottschalkii]|uniref:Transglutaminase-like enzyme, putative cysteine protease n=1 Tax=Methanobrevibacter gottschalkii TaxID=190974 RepID=A0A1H7NNJ4_9EURY|nr:Transglutaminase-like enzyme, putative cysteine protease [Methanobrevibacter gottschalkii]